MGNNADKRRRLQNEEFNGVKVFKKFGYLGEKISKVNYATKHRIINKAFGGSNGKENHALICTLPHDELHLLQNLSMREFKIVRDGLQQFKATNDIQCLLQVQQYFRESVSAKIDVEARRLRLVGPGYEPGGIKNPLMK